MGSFRLPSNVDGVWKTLVRDNEAGRVPRRFAERTQAQRVAWRVLKDWVEAQMSILEAGMVSLDQVMLPYLLAPGGETVYEALSAGRLPLALPAGESAG